MIDDYTNDEDFASIMAAISNNLPHEPYSLKDGFLLHGSRLCITKKLRDKVLGDKESENRKVFREIEVIGLTLSSASHCK